MLNSREVCGVCFSQCLVLEHGSLTCTVCGTQSQNLAEEAMDIEEQRNGVAIIRNVKQQKQFQQRSFEQPAVGKIVYAYCMCLQETLFVSSEATADSSCLNVERN